MIPDVFASIAGPQRRRILGALADGEQAVGRLGMSQPLTSKHLRMLRRADLVIVRRRLNAPALRPVHQWIGSFERFWKSSFDRLDNHLHVMQSGKLHAPRN